MNQRYRDVLDHDVGARIIVAFTTRRREVVDYAVILTVDDGNGEEVVRVYDGAHGVNDMHRHGAVSGKALAETFHAGTLAEGMRAAITAVRIGYKEMIDAWRAT
jgi:hypothetical protein